MDIQKYKYKTEQEIIGNFSKVPQIDKNDTGKKAARAATDEAIPGSGHVRNAYNGSKQRQKGRIGGAAKNIYKHSFLSWKEKGSHLSIKKGDFFYINFPTYNQDEYAFENVFSQIDNYGNPLI